MLEIRSDIITKRIVLVMAMMTMKAMVIMIWYHDTLNRPPSLNKRPDSNKTVLFVEPADHHKNIYLD